MDGPNPAAHPVVLGVGGGIAAYKACELLRRFTESGHTVRVVPTRSALEFVGAATWAALSGAPVTDDVWTGAEEVPHIRLGRQARLVVIAPATADLLARAATGRADDLLTAVLLTTRAPVVFAPAMHPEMWEHPATRANVALLRSRGSVVLDPASGRLTGTDSGVGRLPDPEEIFQVCRRLLARAARPDAGEPADLTGRTVVVSAGGTREPVDAVRFLGNRSSGRQGYALARTAAARGARVVLVAANVDLPDPAGVRLVRVETARQLQAAVEEAAAAADAVIMAAAVADWRPAQVRSDKIHKSEGDPGSLVLVENPDILARLAARRPRPDQVVVGVAAETTVGDAERTSDLRAAGRAKLARKGCELLVVNEVGEGRGFGTPDNEAVIFGSDGSLTEVARGPKEDLADTVWDLVSARLPG